MKTEELESILNSGTETTKHEFKSSMNWESTKFVKSILAMANHKNGGYIIVGVDNKNTRVGLSESQINTYKIENMMDNISIYADPKVEFSLQLVSDSGGLNFIVIKVNEFDEIPVICKKDNSQENIQLGCIYYRNSNRRPESAKISNSNDMRELIERAAVKKMKRMSELIRILNPEDDSERKSLTDELEGL